ncbi:DUF881 domain-containing protein [Cellulomonas shaoxiangyii]|uniref:DUF881 domain-containing protein n=1 Tax=Cellulomonas shaoxiangyii TaxID=2566013 RepID=A0A4P7SMQ1_9CELL|nr:DUF881 domain-containing protein [Cellulomonas shaoxiangyii]TGY86429.1 DUF881 domain-containing protein [Cellulomonas shaoxiangyii]
MAGETAPAVERTRRARVGRGAVAVGAVLGLSGTLFTVSARTADAGADRHPQDLGELSRQQAANVERMSVEVDALRSDVERLAAEQNAVSGYALPTPSAADLVEGGSVPVVGPGLTVVLDDAPADAQRESLNPDVLVVHQQDLQAVMNALWAGGAEAMGLMDQRVVSTSAFWCVGNVLRLHGRVYSPPYVVRAIGDPQALRAGLDASPAVRGYVRDSVDVGLGWDVAADERIELPAYSGATELSSARVPGGIEVLPGLPTQPDAFPARGAEPTEETAS